MKNKKIKLKGGNVGNAINEVINSMKDLGRSMFFEINALSNMQNDIDAGPSATNGTPGQIQGPPRKQYSI
jgi:hypothetical protein